MKTIGKIVAMVTIMLMFIFVNTVLADHPRSDMAGIARENVRALEWGLTFISLFVAFILLVLIPRMNQSKAREYIIKNIGTLQQKIAEIEQYITLPGVTSMDCDNFNSLRANVALIHSNPNQRNVDWIRVKDYLISLENQANTLSQTIRKNIDRFKVAEEYGPELLEHVREKVSWLQHKLETGQQSVDEAIILSKIDELYIRNISNLKSWETIPASKKVDLYDILCVIDLELAKIGLGFTFKSKVLEITQIEVSG